MDTRRTSIIPTFFLMFPKFLHLIPIDSNAFTATHRIPIPNRIPLHLTSQRTAYILVPLRLLPQIRNGLPLSS